MNKKPKTAVYLLGLSLSVLIGLSGTAVLAAQTDSHSQVGLMEHRFFFHQYSQDPVEKRLERLELLIYGSIQPGTNDERVARLRQTIAERDKHSAGQAQSENKSGGQAQAPHEKAPTSSTQYPILNTLEWKALKKTFPQDSLDARLERLETKLFGQSSPAMAYADRVERLNRTLGVGATAGVPVPRGPVGPRPKAVPRGQTFGFGTTPGMPNMPMVPGMPAPMMPFSSINPWDMNNQVNEMFRQLDQQMQQMMQMNPGNTYQWHYEYGTPEGQGGGKTPDKRIPRPGKPAPAAPQELPPYYDPNST